MIFKTFQYYEEENIGYVNFSTPPQNRMTFLFFEEFEKIIVDIKKSDIIGLIITGEGRHFSSGADTDELIEIIGGVDKEDYSFLSKNVKTFLQLEQLDIPTVAAIKGCCFGAALELAMCCTFILSTKNSVFSLPESEFGLMPGCGGTIRLAERVGNQKAIELILRGQTFSAEEALAIGVVDHICEKKELLKKSKELIIKIQNRVLTI